VADREDPGGARRAVPLSGFPRSIGLRGRDDRHRDPQPLHTAGKSSLSQAPAACSSNGTASSITSRPPRSRGPSTGEAPAARTSTDRDVHVCPPAPGASASLQCGTAGRESAPSSSPAMLRIAGHERIGATRGPVMRLTTDAHLPPGQGDHRTGAACGPIASPSNRSVPMTSAQGSAVRLLAPQPAELDHAEQAGLLPGVELPLGHQRAAHADRGEASDHQPWPRAQTPVLLSHSRPHLLVDRV
jgi:hypothetical protein